MTGVTQGPEEGSIRLGPDQLAEIREQIRHLLASELECSAEDLHDDTNIVDDLGADSLTLLEILSQLSETLGFEVDIRVILKRARRKISPTFSLYVEDVLGLLDGLSEFAPSPQSEGPADEAAISEP